MTPSVLEILENNMGSFISGEAIATQFGMTRANVWKEIQKLKAQGYRIESVRNQGYRLIDLNGNLSKSQILTHVHDALIRDVEYLESVDSTNTYAKLLAQDRDVTEYVVVSDLQTDGRGRMGRSFYSPSKNGVYMSFILRPNLALQDTQLLTIAAAVAVVQSIKQLYDVDVDIKWLNDIYSNKRKLCGILTEGEIVLESSSYRYLILGLGINVYTDSQLPESIQSIYTALDAVVSQPIDRNQLVGAIINNFYDIYQGIPQNRDALLHEYKASSIVLGEVVHVNNDPNQSFTAIDIDDHGYLIVEDDEHNRHILNAGEVSIGGSFKNEN